KSRIMGLYEDVSCLGIRSHPAPVRPAVAWKDDRASRERAFFMEQKRSERTSVVEPAGLLIDLHARLCVLRRRVFSGDQVLFLETCASQSRRLEREGLGRRIPFARYISSCNGSFLDSEDRLSGLTVQDEHPALFSDRSHDRNRFSVLLDVE